MVSGVAEVVASLERIVHDLEPGALSGRDAALLVDAFAKAKRLCATAEALCAKRATEASVHRQEGHRSTAAWLASRSGDSVGQAMNALSTAEAADHLPHVAEALRSGELSMERAGLLVGPASANPNAEAELVDMAKRVSMRDLRDRARRLEAVAKSAADESARYEAIRRGRYLKHWTDPDGALRLDARLAPDDGAKVVAGISRLADRIFCQARAAGLREPPGSYAADALVRLTTGEVDAATNAATDAAERTQRPPAQVSVRVDATALRRGFALGEEVCEIPGVGPIPVASARAILGDAWLRIVISDGVDVASVCHIGRTVPAHLRSALQERDQRCVVPGCDVSHGLEIDHWQVDFADGGPTTLANLARVCKRHHLLKTHQGFRLEGGPGRWRWIPPDRAGPPATDGNQPSLFGTASP